jgi:hypothetical protein
MDAKDPLRLDSHELLAASVPATAATAPEPAAQAAFNPFGTIGIVVREPAPAAPQPQDGDWSLPLTAAIVGLVFIGGLLRKLVE